MESKISSEMLHQAQLELQQEEPPQTIMDQMDLEKEASMVTREEINLPVMQMDPIGEVRETTILHLEVKEMLEAKVKVMVVTVQMTMTMVLAEKATVKMANLTKSTAKEEEAVMIVMEMAPTRLENQGRNPHCLEGSSTNSEKEAMIMLLMMMMKMKMGLQDPKAESLTNEETVLQT